MSRDKGYGRNLMAKLENACDSNDDNMDEEEEGDVTLKSLERD